MGENECPPLMVCFPAACVAAVPNREQIPGQLRSYDSPAAEREGDWSWRMDPRGRWHRQPGLPSQTPDPVAMQGEAAELADVEHDKSRQPEPGATKRKRADAPRPQPLRTQPRRGVSKTADGARSFSPASNDGAKAVDAVEPSTHPVKRVRLASHPKRTDKMPGDEIGPASKEAELSVPFSESTNFTGARPSVVWRGELNDRLANIMAKEYGRITNPMPGTGKLKVYREWGARLGIGAVDVDGSRVRKRVARMVNEFEKAFALREQGNHTREDVLAVCPQFFVLLPVLRPDGSSTASATDEDVQIAKAADYLLEIFASALGGGEDARISPPPDFTPEVAPTLTAGRGVLSPVKFENPKRKRGRPQKQPSGVVSQTEGEVANLPSSAGSRDSAPMTSKSPLSDDMKRGHLAEGLERLKARISDLCGEQLDMLYRRASEDNVIPLLR
jgi:hypothetical protein